MNRVSMGMPCFCYVLKIDNFIGGGGDNEGRRNMRRKSNEKEYGL